MLTLAYITARKDPHWDWFLDSLALQDPDCEVPVIIVDRCKEERGEIHWKTMRKITHVTPKPSVWQGKHRLTKEDWFACANARNTALCLAPDGWIGFIDDLSVLMPGWLNRVRAAMDGAYIVFGAYKKVKNLMVQNGEVLFYDVTESGIDARMIDAKEDLISCSGQWLFGCSLAAPVEAFLTINGFGEYVDGMGFEDATTGVVLGNTNKYGFRYDKKMLTLESDDFHGTEPSLRRTDKGQSPHDKSHSALHIAQQSKYFPNYFGEEGIRGLRQRVLAGEPFPVMGVPEHDWYDSQPIREMV